MRGLILLTLLAAVGWSGYWALGSSAQKTAIEIWLEDRRDEGWVAEVEDFEVAGFPNRFDSTFSNLELVNPHGGWNWLAPEFQLLALSYKPNHIIAVWPGEHIYGNANGDVAISSDLSRGSLIFKPDTALSLDRLQMEIEKLELVGQDWTAKAAEANAAFFAVNAPHIEPNSYDLYIKALEFAPPTFWHEAVDKSGNLPDTIPEAILDATLTYDRPWDRFAIEDTNPNLTKLDIKNIRFVWGDIELRGVGSITVSNDKMVEGEFALQARNWRELVELISTTQALNPEMTKAVERGMKILALASGNPEHIEIPLRFSKGLTYIGIVPIGPAPKI